MILGTVGKFPTKPILPEPLETSPNTSLTHPSKTISLAKVLRSSGNKSEQKSDSNKSDNKSSKGSSQSKQNNNNFGSTQSRGSTSEQKKSTIPNLS